MSDRPMHTVPGLFERLTALYADGERAIEEGRLHDAEAIADFDRLLAMRPVAEGYQLRGYAKLNLGRGHEAVPDLLEANRLEQDTYTDYLLAWAGAVTPDDELFYRSMQAVLAADPAT